ncbi:MAG: tRNA (guanosine(46)-N(7))-methyltransferase TrmB [Alphaproteobacteria bacterium]
MTEDRPPAGRVYGRRRGRPLRGGRQALIEDLLPRLRLEVPAAGRLDPQAIFGCPVQAVWLEIGFGGGEHLAWQAAAHPDIGMIGAEVFLNGVASLLAHVADAPPANLRLFPDDARALLDALPDASLDRVFLLFPDPWPKQRHHRRRFIQPANLDRLARIMRDGAELRMASDHMDYLRWMLFHTQRHPDFVWQADGPEDWRHRTADWPETRYEAKAKARGLRPAYLRFRRRPRAAAAVPERP